MRQRPLSLSLSSAAATAFLDSPPLSIIAIMYSQPRPRPRGGGGRGQWGRGSSDSPENHQPVSGDSHFHSVRARSPNPGFHPPPYGPNYNNFSFNGYNALNNPRFRAQSYHSQRPAPMPDHNRNLSPEFGYRPRPPSNQRRPKPNDYRSWEVAKNPPPPTSERFSVLSYNILADYLANTHRSKLYYHIPRHFMDWEWRRKSILFELGLWSADIMCFQEVDRFSDLQEDLRNRGYTGIWKMRTGNPVDGCAMFWRILRFKLVHEEYIEFNKLGMRDNVAQICVLESLIQKDNGDESTSSKSPTGPNKVVICNIHVLYNPRRGEIKLGQVRVLLDKAQAVSKFWNDAPIVICGDFNCTPKSPLYNFISEQKLDLSELDRDKVSGQVSAEIPTQPREFRPHSGVIPNSYSVPTPAVVENMGSSSEHNASSVKQLHSQSYSANEVPATAILENRASEEEIGSSFTERNHEERVTPSQSEIYLEAHSINCEMEKLPTAPANFSSNEEISEDSASAPMVIEAKTSTALETNTSDTSLATEFDVGEKFEGLSLGELDGNAEDNGQDSEKFLSELHLEISEDSASTPMVIEAKASTALETNTSDTSLAIEFDVGEKFEGLSLEELDGNAEDNGQDSEKFLSELHLGDDNLEDLSPRINYESFNMERYDPSLWTPMEIATATGNADCTLLEHPLKLRSTYAEVEGSSETRQLSGEPVLTSYNRCFMGTVDYIWRTEGLQTLHVLAPLPKSVVQWTQGFPTRKWGSDHVALVSELAFTKDSE